MNNKLNYDISRTGKFLVIIDILIVVLSMLSSWYIRSQFQFFLYGMSKFIFLFPWIFFSRIFFHFFFGLYSFSLVSLNNTDIVRIFKYNVIPSVVLLLLRFTVVSNELFRMPISMIFMEYIFSTVGFLLVRLILHTKKIKIISPRGFRRKAILWAEVKEMELLVNIEELFEKQNIVIVGIINSNPLFWNTEYNNIRVFGDENEINKISAGDDSISTIAFLNITELTRKQKKSISEKIKNLNFDIGQIKDNHYENKSIEWLKV